MMEVAKTYLDEYMMECFRVGDIKLIFLSGCDKNHFEKLIAQTPRKALILITLPSASARHQHQCSQGLKGCRTFL